MFIWCAHIYSFAFTITWFCGLANNPPTKAKLWRLDWHVVALTIAIPFDMLMISSEPCIYGFHIFVSSTWLTKVIFDLLGNTHLLFIFTALQIWHGFKPLAIWVACSKKNSFVSYSKTHLIVNYSNSHLRKKTSMITEKVHYLLPSWTKKIQVNVINLLQDMVV